MANFVQNIIQKRIDPVTHIYNPVTAYSMRVYDTYVVRIIPEIPWLENIYANNITPGKLPYMEIYTQTNTYTIPLSTTYPIDETDGECIECMESLIRERIDGKDSLIRVDITTLPSIVSTAHLDPPTLNDSISQFVDEMYDRVTYSWTRDIMANDINRKHDRDIPNNDYEIISKEIESWVGNHIVYNIYTHIDEALRYIPLYIDTGIFIDKPWDIADITDDNIREAAHILHDNLVARGMTPNAVNDGELIEFLSGMPHGMWEATHMCIALPTDNEPFEHHAIINADGEHVTRRELLNISSTIPPYNNTNETNDRTYTIDNPTLVAWDAGNGTGSTLTIPGELTITIPHNLSTISADMTYGFAYPVEN